MDLLRFSTAGSVDDGKSTLIGRLLYDSKGIFEDQLAAIERTSQRRGYHAGRPGAPDRRAARRARAGHHHRRRLPLLRHAAPQVHHRRHARPRSVHAQHGHRRVHRGPRDRAHRCAQRRPGAVAPACLHRHPAGHPAPRGRGQQDGPRWLQRGGLRRHPAKNSRPGRRSWTCTTSSSSPSRRCTATTWSRARWRCPGTRGRRCSTTSSTSTSARTAT